MGAQSKGFTTGWHIGVGWRSLVPAKKCPTQTRHHNGIRRGLKSAQVVCSRCTAGARPPRSPLAPRPPPRPNRARSQSCRGPGGARFAGQSHFGPSVPRPIPSPSSTSRTDAGPCLLLVDLCAHAGPGVPGRPDRASASPALTLAARCVAALCALALAWGAPGLAALCAGGWAVGDRDRFGHVLHAFGSAARG